MNRPSLQVERKLWRKGFKRVACLDESGRGPLSGPVVAAAVMIENCELKVAETSSHLPQNSASPRSAIENLRDSKKLSPKKRAEFYKILTRHPAIEWGIGKVSEKVIDKINILEATKLAMKRAIKNLKTKKPKNKKTRIDFLILDGNFKIDLKIPQKSIIKADEKVFSCAAASILAKVKRDGIMKRYHKKYPQYGFDRNKGYGTKFHFNMLKKYGPSTIHRLTFKPIKN